VLILDTNVISEILRQEPKEAVVTWFESQPRQQLFTTAVTQAEILYGITLLPKGSRREKLLEVAQLIFEEDLENRILPFGCTISRNGPARFRVNGPTLHGLPAEPRFGSSTRPFSLRQVF
jgi:predicted nucleic acid-binding protein